MNIDRTTLPTVRMIDGKEVEKPEKPLSPNTDENWDKWTAERERYNSAKEYRYLPTWNEYWMYCYGSYAVNDCSFQFDTYFSFIMEPLSLGQFIAVDEEGKPLEKPYIGDFMDGENFQDGSGTIDYDKDGFEHYCRSYRQAKERVLFDGWELLFESLDEVIHIEHTSGAIVWVSEHGWRFAKSETHNGTPIESINDLIHEMKKHGLKLIVR